MKYNKLLCVKSDNSIIVYNLSYDENDIKKLATFINRKYSLPEKEIVKTSFLDDVPISFGKCDNNKLFKINKYHILTLNINSDESIGNNELLYFPKNGIGTMEVSYDYLTQFATILEDTFLTDEKHVLIDMTDLIKYRNTIYNINNNFKFDKTIDLALKNKKKRTKWINKIDTFMSLEDYNNHLSRLAYTLNEPLEFINPKENKKMHHDLGAFVEILHGFFVIEEIAMFPINTNKSKGYKIIERYATRNFDCNYVIHNTEFDGWFGRPLNDAEINFSGGKILNDYIEKINKTYDLDGEEYNINAIKSIKNNEFIKEYSMLKKINQ